MKNNFTDTLAILSIGLAALLIGLGIETIINNSFLNWLSNLIHNYQILIAGLLAILAALINSRAILKASLLPHRKADADFIDSMTDIFVKIQVITNDSHRKNPNKINTDLLELKEKINLGKIHTINKDATLHTVKVISLIDSFHINDGIMMKEHLSELKKASKEVVFNLQKSKKL